MSIEDSQFSNDPQALLSLTSGDHEDIMIAKIKFEGIELSDMNFADSIFDSCDFVDSAFRDCKFNFQTTLRECNFSRCRFIDCSFEESGVESATFQECTIEGLKVDQTDFTNSNFYTTKISDAFFENCRLQNSDLMFSPDCKNLVFHYSFFSHCSIMDFDSDYIELKFCGFTDTTIFNCIWEKLYIEGTSNDFDRQMNYPQLLNIPNLNAIDIEDEKNWKHDSNWGELDKTGFYRQTIERIVNISPEEVELTLLSHCAIRLEALVGAKELYIQEKVKEYFQSFVNYAVGSRSLKMLETVFPELEKLSDYFGDENNFLAAPQKPLDNVEDGFALITFVFDISEIKLDQTNGILNKIESLNRIISADRSFEFVSSHRGSQHFTFKVTIEEAVTFNQSIAQNGVEVVYDQAPKLSLSKSYDQKLIDDHLKAETHLKKVLAVKHLLESSTQMANLAGIDIQELLKKVNEIYMDADPIIKEMIEKDDLIQLIIQLPKKMRLLLDEMD